MVVEWYWPKWWYSYAKIILFFDIFQTECGEYLGILYEILSVLQNTVMNLNNVMTKYLDMIVLFFDTVG